VRTFLVGRRPLHTLLRVAAILALAFVLFGYVLLPVRGEGPSMSPAIEDGDLVFVNRVGYWRSSPERGDIVAVRLAGPRVVYLKRVVALPGEQVRIDRGTVFVNGAPLEEPYALNRRPWTVGDTTLEDDEYLVVGDNRRMAIEAHAFGKIRRARILGPVLRLR
jgi:signal peptidase I